MWKIYKIVCDVNNKVYIGNTKNSVEQRWFNGKGYSRQPEIYSDIIKYGWDNFSKEVLCECDTLKESRRLEAEFIKKFNSVVPNGYNTLKGTFNICENGEHLKNICQISKTGKLEKVWANVSELKEKYSENKIRSIRMQLFNAQNSKLTMSSGWFWVLQSDLHKFEEEDFYTHFKANEKYSCNKDNSSKNVYQYSLEGKLIKIYKTRREVVNTNSEFKRTSVLRAIQSKKPYKGYFWSYKSTLS